MEIWDILEDDFTFEAQSDGRARSVGASYSESGVSNDLVCIHPVSDVRPEKTSKPPNGICAGQTRNLQR
jgi:hypothetical protein